jgi:hypothetical protein
MKSKKSVVENPPFLAFGLGKSPRYENVTFRYRCETVDGIDRYTSEVRKFPSFITFI